MNNFTPKERAEIVTMYLENGRSIVLAQRAYRRKYRGRKVPSDNTIRNVTKNFEESGSVANHQRVSVRKRRSNEIVETVKQSVLRSPNLSYRHRAQQLNIKGTTLRRILKEDLHMFPYKVQITQRLLPTDEPRRLEYGKSVVRMAQVDSEFWNQILFTDEAHFHLSGGVNKQNCRFWGTDNPHIIHEKPLHDQKVTVWAGVSAKTIIGPFFFREGETVDGDRYRWILAHYVIPKMREKNLLNFWFQQDGAPCHTAIKTMNFLKRKFPGRLMSKGGDIECPPRSPELTPLDFFCGVI